MPQSGYAADLLSPETYRSFARSIKKSIFRKKDIVTITITSPVSSASSSASAAGQEGLQHLDQPSITSPSAPATATPAVATAAMPSVPTPTVTLTNGEKVAMRKAVLTKKKKLRRRNGGGRVVEIDADQIAHGALTPSAEPDSNEDVSRLGHGLGGGKSAGPDNDLPGAAERGGERSSSTQVTEN